MTKTEFERVRAATLCGEGPPDNWRDVILGLMEMIVELRYDVAREQEEERFWRNKANNLEAERDDLLIQRHTLRKELAALQRIRAQAASVIVTEDDGEC